jgi:Mn-containing catalase
MSHGEDARGPWNEGQGPWPAGEEWEYIDDPVSQVEETTGQDGKEPAGHERDEKSTKRFEKKLAKERSAELSAQSEMQWSTYAGVDA